MSRSLIASLITIAVIHTLGSGTLRADEVTYVSETGQEIKSHVRLLGTTQGFQGWQRQDGQIQLVPVAAVTSRMPNDTFSPIDVPGLTALLRERFSTDLVRTETSGHFLVALVLSASLDKPAEARAAAFLKKAARFMDNLETVFLRFAKSAKFPLHDPEFPLVLLIFESDDDFNAYAVEATGGNGLTAQAIAGFYSGLTNWLAVRMSSCDTFEVPLHEAIHQQMYNRVLHRFASIPKWFDEGIATGFESSGDRIDVYPARVNSRYARQSLSLNGANSWENLIGDDAAFTADILAGDAYTLAWCMHWMLCTQYEEQYTAFVNELAAREPFGPEDAVDERVQEFETAFGTSASSMQASYPRALEASIRRQKINLQADVPKVGKSVQQQALGSAEISAQTVNGGPLQVQGGIKNISPLRTLSFYVTVEASSGTYVDWMIPDVKPGQMRPLPKQIAVKSFSGSGGPPGSFRVHIRSTAADSDEAAHWKSGQVPGPASGER